MQQNKTIVVLKELLNSMIDKHNEYNTMMITLHGQFRSATEVDMTYNTIVKIIEDKIDELT